jgi:hypothetical protein
MWCSSVSRVNRIVRQCLFTGGYQVIAGRVNKTVFRSRMGMMAGVALVGREALGWSKEVEPYGEMFLLINISGSIFPFYQTILHGNKFVILSLNESTQFQPIFPKIEYVCDSTRFSYLETCHGLVY